MTRFLVTGSTGFIGSAVVEHLRRKGHDVLSIGRNQMDVLSASDRDLAKLVEDAGATHCIHCAWYTNHGDYLVSDINKDWLVASARLAKASSSIRFIGLGSCAEYDLSGNSPCSEDLTPLAPTTLYGGCKRDLFEALSVSQPNFAWARVFFVYGPGDREGRLVPDMIARFSRGESAGPTYGGVRRDYVHVADLAAQIVQIATSHVQGAVNTGTGHAPTLSELFKTGARLFGKPELAQSNERTAGQPPMIAPDLSKFRRDVAEVRARSIEAGLADLIEMRH